VEGLKNIMSKKTKELIRPKKWVFNREQVMVLAGVSTKQLSHWEKQGIISPYREERKGNTRSACFYTFDQLIKLKLISKLRKKISFQKIREANFNLEKVFEIKNLKDKLVVVLSDKISIINREEFSNLAFNLPGKELEQQPIYGILSMDDIYLEMVESGKKEEKIVDLEVFENEAKLRGFLGFEISYECA